MDMFEFTYRKIGIEDEYQKILKNNIKHIIDGGRTRQSLNEEFEELKKRKEKFLEYIQHVIIEISLEEKSLHEIDDNWNVKKYWEVISNVK